MLPKPRGTFPRLLMFDNGSVRHIPPMAGCYRIVCGAFRRTYIGSSHNLVTRFLQHREQLMRRTHQNSWLQRAFNRVGPASFTFQVLELYHARWSPDCLAPMEQRWMDQHDRVFNRRRAGSDAYIQGTGKPISLATRKRPVSAVDAPQPRDPAINSLGRGVKAGGGPFLAKREATRPRGRKPGPSQ